MIYRLKSRGKLSGSLSLCGPFSSHALSNNLIAPEERILVKSHIVRLVSSIYAHFCPSDLRATLPIAFTLA